MLDVIAANIDQFGYHVTLVRGHLVPRFAYTIGLTDRGQHELVLAGSSDLLDREVANVIEAAVAVVEADPDLGRTGEFTTRQRSFSLAPVHDFWVNELMLGATDYYGTAVKALQIVPAVRTIDVPDLDLPWPVRPQAAWRWQFESWSLPVPGSSVAITNLAALAGEPLTEIARWESDEWEMFAGRGPEIVKEDVRVVPLSTLVGSDTSLEPLLGCSVGEGWYRRPPDDWLPWRPQT